jgi:hypothetical protein
MNVLVACEYSGRVRDAFARRGHYAVSCDLLPSEAPGMHYQGDVRDILYTYPWDALIAFPSCQFLCSSGLHWNDRGRGHEGTEDALAFVRLLLAAPIKKIALENPKGCISTRIRPPDQVVQPYDFGDDASKATCLWLKGLPLLVPTSRCHGRMVLQPNGKTVERWANQTDSGQNKLGPSADRWKLRSTTYLGIADAMGAQWGNPFL